MKQLSSLLKIPVSAIFIFFSLAASGGDPYHLSAGAGEAGTGNICVIKNSFWSSFHNQANLAFNTSLSAGFNYENRFNIRELGTRTAGIIVPAGKVSIATVYSHFGNTDFKRDMAGVACGMKLSGKMSAGIQVDYFSERASGEYGNHQTVTCELGMLVMLSENTRLGIHIFNPIPGSIRKTYLPPSLNIGAGTYLNKLLFAGVEAEMSTRSRLVLKTGFEYEVMTRVMLRGGYITENNSFCFGLGFMMKKIKIDIGFVTHEKLGVISSVSLIFEIRS